VPSNLGGLEITIERDRAPEPRGPEVAAADAVRRIAGADPNGRSPDDLEAIDRGVLAQGKRHARLFKLAKPQDAADWADLRHQHESTTTVRILRIKELIDGVDYAQFMEWVEFAKPEEEIRASATKERDAFLQKVKAKEAKDTPKPERKRALKKTVTIPLAIPDAPPPTHQALEDPK